MSELFCWSFLIKNSQQTWNSELLSLMIYYSPCYNIIFYLNTTTHSQKQYQYFSIWKKNTLLSTKKKNFMQTLFLKLFYDLKHMAWAYATDISLHRQLTAPCWGTTHRLNWKLGPIAVRPLPIIYCRMLHIRDALCVSLLHCSHFRYCYTVSTNLEVIVTSTLNFSHVIYDVQNLWIYVYHRSVLSNVCIAITPHYWP